MATVRTIEGCSELYFLFTATGLSWRQGQEECERLGGYLAEIKSQDQQDFLVREKHMWSISYDALDLLEKLGNVGGNFNEPNKLDDRWMVKELNILIIYIISSLM